MKNLEKSILKEQRGIKNMDKWLEDYIEKIVIEEETPEYTIDYVIKVNKELDKISNEYFKGVNSN